MKTYRILATLVLVVLLASACGPTPTPAPPTPTAGPPPTEPPEEVSGTVRFYKGPFAPVEMEAQENIIALFNEEYPNVEVIFELYDWPTMEQQITSALAAGTHDVVYIPMAMLPKFCYEGGPLEDLRPYVTDSAWKDEYESIRLWEYAEALDGTICAVPYVWGVNSAFFANLDLLEEAGVPDDWYTSVDGVRDAAVAVHETNPDAYGIAWRTAGLANFSQFDWYGYMLRSGANYLNEDFSGCGMNKPELVETFQWLVDLQQMEGVTPEFGAYTWDGLRGLWQGGKLAITHDETLFWKTIKTNPPDFEWDIFPIPGNVKDTILGIPGFLTITANSENKEAAWEVIKFYVRGDVHIPHFINVVGSFPARKDALEYDVYPEDPFFKHAIEVFLNYGYSTFQMHPQMVEFQNLVQPLFDEMMQGKITPQEMVDQACEQIEAKLKK